MGDSTIGDKCDLYISIAVRTHKMVIRFEDCSDCTYRTLSQHDSGVSEEYAASIFSFQLYYFSVVFHRVPSSKTAVSKSVKLQPDYKMLIAQIHCHCM